MSDEFTKYFLSCSLAISSLYWLFSLLYKNRSVWCSAICHICFCCPNSRPETFPLCFPRAFTAPDLALESLCFNWHLGECDEQWEHSSSSTSSLPSTIHSVENVPPQYMLWLPSLKGSGCRCGSCLLLSLMYGRCVRLHVATVPFWGAQRVLYFSGTWAVPGGTTVPLDLFLLLSFFVCFGC